MGFGRVKKLLKQEFDHHRTFYLTVIFHSHHKPKKGCRSTRVDSSWTSVQPQCQVSMAGVIPNSFMIPLACFTAAALAASVAFCSARALASAALAASSASRAVSRTGAVVWVVVVWFILFPFRFS